jgi:hypothetical protein
VSAAARQVEIFTVPEKPKRKSRRQRDREKLKACGKWCSGPCERWHPYREFYPAPNRKDGYQAYCKKCSGLSRTRQNVVIVEERVRRPICNTCVGLAEDRPPWGCRECKEPYVSLEAQLEERYAEIRAGFGQGRGHLYPNNNFMLTKEKQLPGRRSHRR